MSGQECMLAQYTHFYRHYLHTCTCTHIHTCTHTHFSCICNMHCNLIPGSPCMYSGSKKKTGVWELNLICHMHTTHSSYTLTRSHTHTCTPPTHVLPLVHPVELVSTLREARSSGNDTKATRVLAGALKQLRLSRLKPDSTLNAALTSLAKEDSKLFNNPTAIEVQLELISKSFSSLNIFTQEGLK